MHKSTLFLVLLFCVLLAMVVVPVMAVVVYDETIPGSDSTQYSHIVGTTYTDEVHLWAVGPGTSHSEIYQDFSIDKKPIDHIGFNGLHCVAGDFSAEEYTSVYTYSNGGTIVYQGNWKIYRGSFVEAGGYDYYLCYGYFEPTYVNTGYIAAQTTDKSLHGEWVSGDTLTTKAAYGRNGGTFSDAVIWGFKSTTWREVTGNVYVSTIESTSTDITIDKTGTTYNITLDREGEVESCINVTGGDGLPKGEGCGTTDLTYTYPWLDYGGLFEFKYYFEDDWTTLYDDRETPDCAMTFWCRDSSTGNLIDNCYYILNDTELYPGGSVTDYGERHNPFVVNVIPLHDINYDVTKPGYSEVSNIINCPGDTEETVYLDPLTCGAPTGQVCMNVITYWTNGINSYPLGGVTVNVPGYGTKITNSYGTTVFYVANNTNYTVSASKSGYQTTSEFVQIGALQYYTVELFLGTMGTPTVTPTPTATSPPTTYVPGDTGGYIIGRLVSIMGAWLLAGLIIFSFMVGTAYYTQNGMAAIAGGAMGFVISVGLGLIAWIYFLLILAVVVAIIAIKIGGGLGGGTG